MTEKQLRQIWEKTNGHCHFCGDPLEFEKYGRKGGDSPGSWQADHIIQRSKGGSNSVENCLPACTKCNGNGARWHRSGDALRELIALGIIARDEIAKSSATGKALAQLREKRLTQNVLRRKRKSLKATALDTPNGEDEVA